MVFNRLKLDIAGVEEVSSDAAMDSLAKKVPNSKAILSDRWSYSFDPPDPNFPPQKVGFFFDTTTMKLIGARAMFAGLYDSARTGYPEKLSNYPGGTPSSFWASGRLPYMATFDANINGSIKRVRVIVIHAKSASDVASYNRRVYDAKVLKDTLDAFYNNDNVVIVGDYNDRLVNSIYTSSPNSPHKPFIDDNANYTGLTVPLDQAGKTSFIGGTGLIDHVVTTNPLLPSYISNSTEIEDPRTYISGYDANTASDHLPVFSRFSFTNVMPVTLTNFNAEAKAKEVLVSWTTATEINSNRFVVERSRDGRTFNPITVQVSRGTTDVTTYQFIDVAPLQGVSYYRLRQEDKDGGVALSRVIAVSFAGTKNVLAIYPNPVTDRVQIGFKSATTDIVASLINTQGVVLLKAKGDVYQLTQLLNQKLPSLQKGVYILKVGDKQESHLTKLIKQ